MALKPFLSLDNSPYEFRHSTLEKAQQSSLTASPRYRKTLSPSSTPTLIRTPTHDCYTVNLDITRMKVIQRIWNTHSRMQVASTYTCTTWRGTTKFNGSVAHCDCQAAHSSLAPTLYDDKLNLATTQILENGFDNLSPISKKYIVHRFELDSPEKDLLSDPNEAKSLFPQHLKKLSIRQKKGSFVDTETEKKRNATFENPTSSNRLDCHLEYHLRPLEDLLAEACRKQEKTPAACTQELIEKHIQLLEEAIANIKVRQEEFELFLKSYEELNHIISEISPLDATTISREQAEEFIKKTRNFLEAKGRLLKPLSGAPHLNEFVNFFLAKTPYYILREISKDFESLLLPVFLQNLFVKLLLIHMGPITQDIDCKRADISNRLLEAETQLDELNKSKENLPHLDKLFFGVIDENGTRRTPSKEQIADQLIEASHSTANKTHPKKRLFGDIQDQISKEKPVLEL